MTEIKQNLAIIKNENRALATGRLRLELFSSCHITPRYVAWFNDPEVCRFNRHGSGYTHEKALAYVHSLSTSTDTVVFAIFYENFHVGNISINSIDWIKKSAEISILIGESQVWGKGLGLEAVRKICSFAFEDLGLERVWVGFTANNISMKKIAQRAGFVFFNEIKGGFIKPPADPVDIEEWELLKK